MKYAVRTDKRPGWTAEAKSRQEAARQAAQEIGGDLTFGLETPRGGAYFYRIRGGVPYPISVTAAGVEVAMGQGA